MYEKFFGFTEAPFNQTPDPQFLFPSLTHEDAFSQVLYGITHRKGFIVVTGEVGIGKTTLCRHLLATIDPSIKTALILTPGLTPTELLMSVNEEFGIKCQSASKKELIGGLHCFLLDTLAVGGNAVLLIDEAQDLSVECLEEIRLLSNLETTKEKLLQIVLLGQPEMGDMLRLPGLRQLAQRVALRVRLVPLELEETRLYIATRLRAAGGGDEALFTANAVERVYALSRGIPRLINALCDKALLAGFITETKVIEEDLIDEAGREVEGVNRVRSEALPRGPVRPSRLGHPDAANQGLSHSVVPFIPSWVGLVGLVVAGVLGIVFWLGLPWDKVNQTVAPPSPGESSPASVPSSRAVDSSALGGSQARTVGDPKETQLMATLSLLQLWGFFQSTPVDAVVDRMPTSLIEEAGLQLTTLPVEWDMLERLDYPCLLEWKDALGGAWHSVVLVGLSPTDATIFDPLVGRRVVGRSELVQHVTGDAIIFWKALPGIKLPFSARKEEEPSASDLQRLLKENGLYEGPVTGAYDAATHAAVSRLQSKFGLEETGIFGVQTYLALSKLVLGSEAPTLKPQSGPPVNKPPSRG